MPLLQQETIEFLKPKLNSERIEFFFGSYGVDVLNIDSSIFPESRIVNLYSTHQNKKIMRTLGIVDFFQPIHPDLLEVHRKIVEGQSLGMSLKSQNWILQKTPLYFGPVVLSPELSSWMAEPDRKHAVLHVYHMEVSKNFDFIPYCQILELHSPTFLTEDWMQALYEKLYAQCSVVNNDKTQTILSRLRTFINNFPTLTA